MGRTATVVHPFEDVGVFANGAHSAQLDYKLAEQTEALAFRMCGNVKHYAWMTQFKARITTINTWFELAWSASDLSGIPWQQTPGFPWLAGIVTLYTRATQRLTVRLRTTTLVDTVAPWTLATPSDLHAPSVPQDDRGLSNYFGWSVPGCSMGTYNCQVAMTANNLPANGRVAVHVDVYATEFWSAFDVWMGKLVLIEQPDERAGVG